MSSQDEFVFEVDDQGHGRRVRRPEKPQAEERNLAMKHKTIQIVVGSALEDGRIATEECADWFRRFEADPEAATIRLALAQPDKVRAYQNFMDDEKEKAIVSSLTGIPPEEVS